MAMEQNDNIIWQLIADKMGGAISKDDQHLLDELLKESKNKLIYDALMSSDETIFKSDFSYDGEIIFDKIHSKIKIRQKRINALKMVSIAAALLICMFSGFSISRLLEKNPVEWVKYTCQAGGYSHLSLPDSSSIYVNSGSSVSYPIRFTKKERYVELDGEAFFEVAKDPKRPFIVHTDFFDVNVLGTSFNVKSYPEDSLAIVSLVSGKIEFSINDSMDKYILSPNEQATISKTTGKIEIQTVNTDYTTGWKDGKLSFFKTNFKAICKMLERRYGYNIIIRNPELYDIILTGSFSNNENIFQVLSAVKHTVDMHYVLENPDTIVIE